MMTAKGSLLSHEVLPFFLALAALAVSALLVDVLLHILDAVWVGRYLGIPGVLLIIGSFGYSLRKRKLISIWKPALLLRLHERMAWAGSLLVLIHAGIHFNAILAWLAVLAMVINVGSGLTGKFLLQRSRKRMAETAQRLSLEKLPAGEIEERMHWDSLTFEVIKQWRAIHYPITLAFVVLSIAHILSVFLFWGWR